MFASAGGKNGGQFYTPSWVARLLVEMLAPYKSGINDSACGSGGMFVQFVKFVETHSGTAPCTQHVIILRCPSGLNPAFVRKEIHRVAQVLVAASSDIYFVDLPGLAAHRCHASPALQALRVFAECAIAADFAEQTRPKLRSGPWQRPEKVAVGMTRKKGLDALGIDIQLALEHSELLATRYGQEALSGNKGGIAFPLPGFSKAVVRFS